MSDDLFHFKQFSMHNSVSGLKIGTDGVLLGSWVEVKPSDREIWDVGCGTGLIALMIAQRCRCGITAIEIDHGAAIEAEKNTSLSPWGNRVRVVEGDIMNVADKLERPDIIVSNPPYYASSKSLAAGNESRDKARRDGSLSFESLIELADKFLKPDGRLFMVSPYSRKEEIEWMCTLHRLMVNSCLTVSTKHGHEPSRILWEVSRRSCTQRINSMSMRDSEGNLTDEYKDLTKDYYIDF